MLEMVSLTHRRARAIRELYYITHRDNILSILRKGILSHERIIAEEVKYTPIYDEEIVSNRRNRHANGGKSLWSFSNLYFNARNPMLYRVICEKPVDSIAVIGVSTNVLDLPGVLVSDGNAASSLSEIHSPDQRILSSIARETDKEWWSIPDGSKRKIMAECLVPGVVLPDYIKSIYFPSFDAREKASEEIGKQVYGYGLILASQPGMFFQPVRRSNITEQLSVIEGDMFFSRMHTFAVSVNCVGVMGKGVASRAKYQFPDVYVRYQDACRSQSLKLGRPYLYKREISFDQQLADDPSTLKNYNAETWFLLFATKHHWRMRADIDGIEKGLQWICDNFRKEGIQSLAIPALGCGLGGLDWRDVGPLLCGYLSTLGIPVSIYLPLEKGIPDELISKDFLLEQRRPDQKGLT